MRFEGKKNKPGLNLLGLPIIVFVSNLLNIYKLLGKSEVSQYNQQRSEVHLVPGRLVPRVSLDV